MRLALPHLSPAVELARELLSVDKLYFHTVQHAARLKPLKPVQPLEPQRRPHLCQQRLGLQRAARARLCQGRAGE